MMTEIKGNRDAKGRHLSTVSRKDVQRMVKKGTITEGMLPKVHACLDALEQGVGKAHIIDGRIPHAILRHLRSLVGERHPQTAPHALNQAAEYLAARFAEYGWTTSGQPFRALGKSYFNIVGIKSPTGRPAKDAQPPLLIGAHYDTVVGSPGADDNASALAVLLEAADRLRHLVVARPVWLAAFCLEEQGLLGSRAFISGLKQTGQLLGGAIVLECVGYASRDAGSQRTPPGVPIAIPTVGNFLGIVGNEP